MLATAASMPALQGANLCASMNFIGVELTCPKTSTVAVHSKKNGSSTGLVYLIVTAPVRSFFESA